MGSAGCWPIRARERMRCRGCGWRGCGLKGAAAGCWDHTRQEPAYCCNTSETCQSNSRNLHGQSFGGLSSNFYFSPARPAAEQPTCNKSRTDRICLLLVNMSDGATLLSWLSLMTSCPLTVMPSLSTWKPLESARSPAESHALGSFTGKQGTGSETEPRTELDLLYGFTIDYNVGGRRCHNVGI